MQNIVPALLEDSNHFEGASHLVDIEGLSSPRVCNLLNQLVARLADGERYLEVGTWKGLTLMSAAYGNTDKTCVACDKFRVWGRFTGLGSTAEKALKENVRRYAPESANIEFHHMTSVEMFGRGLVKGPVGVYFYDGDHSFSGTRDGVLAALPLLADESLLLMDDFNDPVIRGATYCALKDADVEVEWETFLEGDHTQQGWWNGLGVFYLRKR